ncbi:MAG: CRTAC1 family protein [Myxococcota bacterium]|nr:CRTAC1 family protein [Myxococcota bacterium]
MALPLVSFLVPLGLMTGCNSSDKESGESLTNSDAAWARTYVSDLQAGVNSDKSLESLNVLENAALKVEATVIQPWVQSWMSGDLAAYQSLFVEGSKGISWGSGKFTTTRDTNGITEQSWAVTSGPDQAEAYLSKYSALSGLQVEITHIDVSSEIIICKLQFDLRGTTTDGFRQQDRGYLTITLNNDMKITDVSGANLERLTAQRAPAFADATQKLGLNELPIDDRKEAIRRGGYALVVADFDNDQLPDMLVGNYGPLQLLRNTGNGYVDVTAEAGLADEGVVKSAGFADFDNDGDRDIALLRFVVGQEDARGDFLAYENNGDGTFTRRDNVLPQRRSYDRAMPLTMGDFNNDGNVDIYIGFPGIRDFTSGISNRGRPDWLASQGVWFNNGGWNFTEAEDGAEIIQDNDVYAHAAVSSDLDGDGWVDLLVVDDSGRINPVYKNMGDGKFSQTTEAAGLSQGGLSMGITTGDINNDGLLDIMSTNITMNAAKRMANSTAGVLDTDTKMGQVMETLRDEYTSIQLYVNNGDGTFTDTTSTAGLQWAGEAAAAGEWVDYNHDGLLDYYLPNGLWSNGKTNLDSLFFRAEIAAYGDAILGYPVDEVDMSDPIPNDVHGRPIFATNGGPNPILSVLRNHRNTDEAGLTYSMSGYQHNALFRNNGDGTFTEVGFLENADRIEDGYIVAPVDVNNDGLQDLVLRNTDPAPEHSYAPVIALENQLAGNALTVRLQGVESNRDGFGARVIAHIGEQKIVREVRSVNGAIQAEPVAYIGLSGANTVDRLEVVWPGGARQELLNVSAGVIDIIQGQ